jgi:hypothetical protein
VTTDEILDRLLFARPNGSEGLERAAQLIADALEAAGASVSLHPFAATPHGFQMIWSAALLLVAAYAWAIARRRYGLALALAVALPALLLAEFEALRTPVSGLWRETEHNVVGAFAGAAGGGRLVFGAHYDTTTHFGDHFSWGRWGWRQGPATALALALALGGLARRRRGGLPRALAWPAAALVPIPFAAMFWFHAIGPLARAPSVGAIDNGGSVAALLRLAERLGERPAGAPTRVDLVFFAAEEERTQGSAAWASALETGPGLAVINLESLGASETLALIPEDGFELRRFRSPEPLLRFVDETARSLWGASLPVRELPVGVITDGRSFLARGIPTLTLRAFTEQGCPRGLHSARDSRERLSVAALERSVDLCAALVARLDADPSLWTAISAGGPATAAR